jgi:hypothetical protein
MAIQRNELLKPISREHHHGLLLCWKIRTGLQKGIEPERIKKYAEWFYENHLLAHFDFEEIHIFLLPGIEQSLIKRALSEHRKLRRLFEAKTDVLKTLNWIEELLEAHIRF